MVRVHGGRLLVLGVSALLLGAASCDAVHLDSGNAGAGEAGLVNAGADQGGEPGAAGSNGAPGGNNAAGGAGPLGGASSGGAAARGGVSGGGDAGAAVENAGQAGQGPGGAGSDSAGPRLICPNGEGGQGGGVSADWSWLEAGAAGTASESFHGVTFGLGMTGLRVNTKGQILVRAERWPFANPSCKAWLVDGTSAQPIWPAACVTAIDMNDSGTVLAMHGSRPFLWRAGVVRYLAGVPEGTAVALNNAEQVVLDNWPSGGAALWENGSLTPLESPANEPLRPIAINAVGQVLAYTGSSILPSGTWLWQNGSAVALGLDRVDALNDAGVVAGLGMLDPPGVDTTDRTLGTWQNGTFTPLNLTTGDGAPLQTHDYDELVARAINNRGEIAGTFIPNWEDVDAEPFYYADGKLQFLDAYGHADDIAETGQVVGQHARRVNGSPCCALCDVCGSTADDAAALWVRECPLACCPP